MKILYFFAQYETPMYLWQNTHIVDELMHYGIAVEVFNPLCYETIEQANESARKAIKQGGYDIFMTCESEAVCFRETVETANAVGLPTLLICFDNLVAPYLHRNICACFDLVWLTAIENREFFNKWGATSFFAPYAANPYAFSFHQDKEFCQVAFLGTPYGSRANMINALTKNGVPVTLFYNAPTGKTQQKNGPTMKQNLQTVKEYLAYPVGRKLLIAAAKQRLMPAANLDMEAQALTRHPAVSCEDIWDIYSNYALSLSSTAARNTGVLRNPVSIINLRSFEVPMSGGIQFCRYNKELATYFEEDREIIFYRTEEEMIDKARFYLRPEQTQARTAIRQAARKRAEAEHTWFCRFSKAFDLLGLIAEG